MPEFSNDISRVFRASAVFDPRHRSTPTEEQTLEFVSERLCLQIIELRGSVTDGTAHGHASREDGSALHITGMAPCIGYVFFSPQSGVAHGRHRYQFTAQEMLADLSNYLAEERAGLKFITGGQVMDAVARACGMNPDDDRATSGCLLAEEAHEILTSHGLPPENLFLRDAVNYRGYGPLKAMSLLIVPERNTALIFGEPASRRGLPKEFLLETIVFR